MLKDERRGGPLEGSQLEASREPRFPSASCAFDDLFEKGRRKPPTRIHLDEGIEPDFRVFDLGGEHPAELDNLRIPLLTDHLSLLPIKGELGDDGRRRDFGPSLGYLLERLRSRCLWGLLGLRLHILVRIKEIEDRIGKHRQVKRNSRRKSSQPRGNPWLALGEWTQITQDLNRELAHGVFRLFGYLRALGRVFRVDPLPEGRREVLPVGLIDRSDRAAYFLPDLLYFQDILHWQKTKSEVDGIADPRVERGAFNRWREREEDTLGAHRQVAALDEKSLRGYRDHPTTREALGWTRLEVFDPPPQVAHRMVWPSWPHVFAVHCVAGSYEDSRDCRPGRCLQSACCDVDNIARVILKRPTSAVFAKLSET